MKKVLSILFVLLGFHCFAEGQAGLEEAFYVLYGILFIFYTCTIALIIILIRKLLKWKNYGNNKKLAVFIGFTISIIFILFFPQEFLLLFFEVLN